jgi:hypothetical protein
MEIYHSAESRGFESEPLRRKQNYVLSISRNVAFSFFLLSPFFSSHSNHYHIAFIVVSRSQGVVRDWTKLLNCEASQRLSYHSFVSSVDQPRRIP